MSITLELPPALEDQLREAAAQEGQEVSELVERFLTGFVLVMKAKARHREVLPSTVVAAAEERSLADFRDRRLDRVRGGRPALFAVPGRRSRVR